MRGQLSASRIAESAAEQTATMRSRVDWEALQPKVAVVSANVAAWLPEKEKAELVGPTAGLELGILAARLLF